MSYCYDDFLDDYDARLGIGESPTCSVSSSPRLLDGPDSEPQKDPQEEIFPPLLLKDKEEKTPMEVINSSCQGSREIALCLEGSFLPCHVEHNKNLPSKELLSDIALHIYELRHATAEIMTRNLEPTSDVENELKEQKTLVQNLYLQLDEKQKLLEDCQKQLESSRNEVTEVKKKALKFKTLLHKRLLKGLEELDDDDDYGIDVGTEEVTYHEKEREQNSTSSSKKHKRRHEAY